MALDQVDYKLVDGLDNGAVEVQVYANNSARDSAISSPTDGMIIYNTAESALQQYNGQWSTIAPAPTISSISGTINEDTNTTLTVNGSQFVSGMAVKLVLTSDGTDVSGHTSLSYSLVSSAQITVTIPSGTTGIAAGTVVQVEIVKSGLSVKSSSITVTEDPNWTTSAGTVATIYGDLGTSQAVATLAATAGAGGGTLQYTSDDNSLDPLFVLNSGTGAITTHSSNALTTISGYTSGLTTTEAFNANAKISGDSAKNTVRAFNIIIKRAPTGGTVTTYASKSHRVHVFQHGGSVGSASSAQNFVLHASTVCDILLVAGGGGGGGMGWSGSHGGGGGGAGGFLYYPQKTLAAGTYSIVVGYGGFGYTSSQNATNGGDSTFTGLTSAVGGGKGGGYSGINNQNGSNGGSGGGGGLDVGTGASGTTNQGSNAGNATWMSGGVTIGTAGGGGGASAGGLNGNQGAGGTGGAGYTEGATVYNWTAGSGTVTFPTYFQNGSSNVSYAGGGGGGRWQTSGSGVTSGGAGGGGNGGRNGTNGESGANHLGGGGGGAGANSSTIRNGGNGGSGIVIVRYAF